MAREFAVELDPAFVLNANCSSGAVLQIPIRVRSTDITMCTVRVFSETSAVERKSRELQLLGTGQWQQVIVEVVAQRASEDRAWVSIAFDVGEAMLQTVGFFLIVTP